MAQFGFNATTVTPDSGRPDPVPAGWYKVSAEESEIKPTKDGTGAYLQVRFSILEGDFTGQKLFTRFNIQNANPVTVEISYSQLSAFMHGAGLLDMQDTSQLHGLPLKVKVKLKPAEGEYDAQNEITTYKGPNEVTDPSPTKAGYAAAAPGAPMAPPQAPPGAPMAPQAPGMAPQAPGMAPQAPGMAPQAPAPQAAPPQPWQQPAPAQAAPQAAPQQPAPQAAPQQPAQQPWQQPAPQQAPAQAAPQQPVPNQAPVAPVNAVPAQEPAPAAPPQQVAPAAAGQAEVPPWMQQQPSA